MPSVCLIMTLSQNKSLIISLCQLQILIQTMSLLWIYGLPHPLFLFMVNPQGDSQGDNQGDDLGDDLGDKQGGSQGGNPACLLCLTVPVFLTMMHGLRIGCLHMEILFAPSAMLNTG